MATTRNHDDVAEFTDRQFYQELDRLKLNYSNPKSFVNLLPPPRGFGEGWGGVKILPLLQGLLYVVKLGITIKTTTKEGTEQWRVPDVSVIDRSLWRAERKSYTALESPIQLDVEVVSANWEDDYVDKLDEY